MFVSHFHLIQLRRDDWLDHQECDHIKEKNGELNEYKSITLNTVKDFSQDHKSFVSCLEIAWTRANL